MWCRRSDLNQQPSAYEAIALPLCYVGLKSTNGGRYLSPANFIPRRWKPVSGLAGSYQSTGTLYQAVPTCKLDKLNYANRNIFLSVPSALNA